MAFSAGFSLAIYALFVAMCDERDFRSTTFRAFGRNALAAYVLQTWWPPPSSLISQGMPRVVRGGGIPRLLRDQRHLHQGIGEGPDFPPDMRLPKH